ncbi:MAG: polyprenol monophosphomannose synthase [Candidatus Dormibacteraeota bacterium]|nr:polyprenol monophosphomannose synthase [Candidatus Dormibacteraeota bacterium]
MPSSERGQLTAPSEETGQPDLGGEAGRSGERRTALVVLATYNERENLPIVLERIWAATDIDVLVVDDNSPDGTGVVADRIASRDPRLHVIHREGKAGLASALFRGYAHAFERGYELAIEMDADLSHPPEALPALIAACANADVAIGSRRVPGGRVVGRPAWRIALTAGACIWARTVLGLPIHDCTSGYRCMRTEALRVMDFSRIRSSGYGFLIELDWAIKRAGQRVVEIPITFNDRAHGLSKMRIGMIPEAMIMVLKLRFGLVRAAVRDRAEVAAGNSR